MLAMIGNTVVVKKYYKCDVKVYLGNGNEHHIANRYDKIDKER